MTKLQAAKLLSRVKQRSKPFARPVFWTDVDKERMAALCATVRRGELTLGQAKSLLLLFFPNRSYTSAQNFLRAGVKGNPPRPKCS